MKKTAFAFVLAASLLSAPLTFVSCEEEPRNILPDALGVDLTGADVISFEETHGGFHGDGYTFAVFDVRFAANFDADGWRALPFSDELTKLVYGTSEETDGGVYEEGPFLTSDGGEPLFPNVERGAFWFFDRHDNSRDPKSDVGVISRASINLTLAVYDADAEKLYFCEFDT